MIDALNGNPVAHALGVALLQFVWQGAILSAMTALALYLLRRQSANARYTVACLGLLALLTAPIITMATSAADPNVGRPADLPRVDVQALGAETTPGFLTVPADKSLAAALLRFWDRTRIDRQLPVIVVVWGFGVLLLTLQLAGSWLLVERIRRGATRPIAHVSDTYVQALAGRLGVTRALRLAESARVAVPTVIGWIRPLILVPSSALAGLSPFQLQAIIAHEIAHIRRHDYIVNVLQSLVETLLFYHPGVWWVSKQIRLEREQSCDDVAAEVCGDRVAYARALASLEESRAEAPRPALAASGGDLVTRIRRLLGGPQPATPRSSFMVIGLSIATMSLVFVGPPAALVAGSSAPGSGVVSSPQSMNVAAPAVAVHSAGPTAISVTPTAMPLTAASGAEPRTTAQPETPTQTPTGQPSPELNDLMNTELKYIDAKQSNNATSLSSLLDDEFLGTDQAGITRNKAQTIELARQFRINTTSMKAGDLRFARGVAVLTGSQVEVSRTGTDRLLFTHVWRKDDRGAWKLVSSSQFRDPRQVEPSASPTPFGAPGVSLNEPGQPQTSQAADYERAYLDRLRAREQAFLQLDRSAETRSGSVAAPPRDPVIFIPLAQPNGQPLRIGGDIKEPKKLFDVKPVYPQIAMAANVQGIVILELVLDEQGSVASAQILRSQPLLEQAAIEAVRQWKFTPTFLNGAPIPVVMTVTVNFSLQ